MCGSPITGLSIANTAIGVLIGLFLKEVWDFFSRPTLTITFDENDEGCKAHTQIGDNAESEGYFVRAKVVNTKRRMAKSCRAVLINVEQRNARGDFVPLSPKYDDSLTLIWSARPDGGRTPLDLPSGVTQYVDIVHTDKRLTDFGIHVFPALYRYRTMFDQTPKVLRLTILATGDDVNPGKVKVIFDWRGQWNTFEVAKG